jgi:hypothetical protein
MGIGAKLVPLSRKTAALFLSPFAFGQLKLINYG